uniref:Apea-like HEPN domain-containing protein n=1 Tax=Aliivibrio wodanis TaxID=80852 RepID=A0A5Q4Z034_9GAMM|nr:hypothetical protein AW0309160_03557 [Aliivibrio wodanis]
MEYNYKLLINWNPRHFEVEGISASSDIESIKQIVEVYSKDSFTWADMNFFIQMDWQPFEEILNLSEDVNGPFYMEIEGERYKRLSPFKEISIPINVVICTDIDEQEMRMHLHRYLLDMFVVCNLAAPGLVDFYNAKLEGDNEYTPIKLSNYSFGNALQDIVTKRVPYVVYTDVRKSFDWFRSLNIGTKIVASTPIEKAIFSLLHMVRMDDYDISTIPWIFHALEAIYGTNAGRGFNDISEQIKFLLSVEERQQKGLKNKLRELNNLRSSFIHGGYCVSHIMDQDSNNKIFELVNFGISLVISSIQSLMLNNWHSIYVQRQIVGLPVSAS